MFLIIMGSLFSAAEALDLGSYQVAPLIFGINSVNFGPPGTRGTVVLAWRENFNAHGFAVATFYLTDPNAPTWGAGHGPPWGLVSVWDEPRDTKEALTVNTQGGADCVLCDFRLLVSNAQKPAQLILADREPGRSFADAAGVTFKIYTLEDNADHLIGRPMHYFALTQQFRAKREYCDVELAFQQELGLRDYRDRAD